VSWLLLSAQLGGGRPRAGCPVAVCVGTGGAEKAGLRRQSDASVSPARTPAVCTPRLSVTPSGMLSFSCCGV